MRNVFPLASATRRPSCTLKDVAVVICCAVCLFSTVYLLLNGAIRGRRYADTAEDSRGQVEPVTFDLFVIQEVNIS